jgi:hypothetical protein
LRGAGKAGREGCSVRKINKTISLAFLAPDLVKAAIDGRLRYGLGVARVASRRGGIQACVLVREPFALIEPWHAQQFWCALNSSMIVVEPAMSAHGVGERHRAPGSCLEAVRHLTPAFSQLGHNLFMQPDVHLG